MVQLRRRLGVFVSVLVSFVVVRLGPATPTDSLVEHETDADGRA
jgi:hypothetical protein